MTLVLLTLPAFCERYAVSRSEAYRQHKSGQLRFIKLGRATRIAVEDAEAWFASIRNREIGHA